MGSVSCVASEAFSEGIRAVVTCELRKTVATLESYLPQTLSPDTFPHDLGSVLQRAGQRHDANLGVARSAYAKNRPLLGMNGQFIKASILLNVMRHLEFDYFVETGTKNGFTSLLVLAQTPLRVLTCEIDKERHDTASILLEPFSDRCRLHLQDRRDFLDQVLAGSEITAPFFYLDAQGSDLSLNDEMTRILTCDRLRRFIVVIDDFRVPWDAGFVYDKYPAGSVALEYIEASLISSGSELVVLCPSYAASAETGYPAGFALVCPAAMKRDIEAIVPDSLLRIARP